MDSSLAFLLAIEARRNLGPLRPLRLLKGYRRILAGLGEFSVVAGSYRQQVHDWESSKEERVRTGSAVEC